MIELLSQVPAPTSDIGSWVGTIQDLGLAFCIVVWTLWDNRNREKSFKETIDTLHKRIWELEKEHKDLAKDHSEVLLRVVSNYETQGQRIETELEEIKERIG